MFASWIADALNEAPNNLAARRVQQLPVRCSQPRTLPAGMDAADRPKFQQRKFTAEEKKQLLDNLDIEVAHRIRQFESWLADALENFRIHQEGLISRVPRLVRNITLREFAKYNGDVQACLKGLQREKLGGEAEAIDKTTRKRKWVESQEAEVKATEVESTKGAKSARIMNPVTPRKTPGLFEAPGTAQRSRLPTMKTPGTVCAPLS
ncbi:hypothetical protein NM688_g779 [Phlebia brevispora]|uniref:Uncharacterized protein n=1 Tax=Phlebia brevispora TaxID=194682 RepID=A0ACC1TD15_9APHY|nr:hypothetical protein NM688_g779 [Phlebia brevispora]